MRLSKSLLNREQMLTALIIAGLCLMAVFPEQAFAVGKEGAAFDTIWDTISGWIKGGLGRLLCGLMMLVGVIAGIARQSLMAFGVGVGGGIILHNLPAIVTMLIGATIASGDFGVHILSLFSNGLS